jgi:hypothetical protein
VSRRLAGIEVDQLPSLALVVTHSHERCWVFEHRPSFAEAHSHTALEGLVVNYIPEGVVVVVEEMSLSLSIVSSWICRRSPCLVAVLADSVLGDLDFWPQFSHRSPTTIKIEDKIPTRRGEEHVSYFIVAPIDR